MKPIKLMKFIFILALLILFTESTAAQVTVAPILVSMDDQNRFGTYFVQNRTATPQDVTVEFVFGYPSSDSLGNTFMVYDDSLRGEKSSAAPWIRAFPRVFTVAPGQQQTIRLTSRPPAGIEDGVYWARIKTASMARQPETDLAGTGAVGARIDFRFEQITTVIFRKGQADTGLELNNHQVTSSETDEFHNLLLSLNRSGNAPFLGTMEVSISDAAGSIAHLYEEPVAIYYDVAKVVKIPSGKLRSGTYHADVRFKTRRQDIPASSLVQAPDITDRFTFTVQ